MPMDVGSGQRALIHFGIWRSDPASYWPRDDGRLDLWKAQIGTAFQKALSLNCGNREGLCALQYEPASNVVLCAASHSR